jgi:hypothetical protein
MTRRNVPTLLLLLLIPAATVQQAAQAQTGPGGSDTAVKIDSAVPDRAQGSVPRFIRFSGDMRASNGEPLHGIAGIEVAIYKDREGGGPLWMETQNVAMDEQVGLPVGGSIKERAPQPLPASECDPRSGISANRVPPSSSSYDGLSIPAMPRQQLARTPDDGLRSRFPLSIRKTPRRILKETACYRHFCCMGLSDGGMQV